jgi:hypothetical protein
LFNRPREFRQCLIVLAVKSFREICIDGDTVDLHCSVVLVARKIEQLQTEGLDFHGGEGVAHSGAK